MRGAAACHDDLLGSDGEVAVLAGELSAAHGTRFIYQELCGRAVKLDVDGGVVVHRLGQAVHHACALAVPHGDSRGLLVELRGHAQAEHEVDRCALLSEQVSQTIPVGISGVGRLVVHAVKHGGHFVPRVIDALGEVVVVDRHHKAAGQGCGTADEALLLAQNDALCAGVGRGKRGEGARNAAADDKDVALLADRRVLCLLVGMRHTGLNARHAQGRNGSRGTHK